MISSKNNPKTQPDTKSRPIVPLKPRLNDPKLESQSASSLLKPISLRNNVSPPRLDSINNDYFNAKAPSITNIRNTQASTKRNALPDSLNLHIHHKSVIEDPSKQNLDISTTTRGLSKEREKNGKSTSRLKLSISKTRPRRLSPLKSPPKGSLMPGFLSDNAEEEATPEVKKSGLNLFKAVAKRYMASQRIIHAFESTLGGSLTHHKKALEDENNSAYSGEDSVIIDSMQQNKEKLLQMISMIENCVSCRKNKPELERYMEKVVELAQKTRNFELQISALKTQAKVLFTYNDLYRAIGAFKAIKHLADFNKSFTAKLKAYKYLAFCFHKVQNYKMAIFYYIKMLQTAWLCNSKRYELLAYDKIGIAYYYLGSLEKANYYHEKMMAGVGEPMDSKLRELGISKLLQRLEGIAGGVRKNIKINKVEDELNGYNIPASEDEFELPSPRNMHISHSNNEFASGHEGGDSTGPGKKRRALHILNKMMNDQNGREKKSVRSRPTVNVEAREAHSLTLNRSKNEVVPGSVMQQVLISHLSPNRLLGNFHPKDAQYIANSYIARGNEGEESYAVLDAKSLEQIRRKLEKLKENTEIALRKLLELQPETSLRKGGNKAQLGEKNKKTFIFQA